MDRASLHHQLQNEKVLLNNTIGDNKDLKVQINIMRQELLSAARQIQTMQRQIDNFKAMAAKANEHSTRDEGKASDTNNKILALKAKHEEGKEQFELEIKKL